jgi:hypothetical protein
MARSHALSMVPQLVFLLNSVFGRESAQKWGSNIRETISPVPRNQDNSISMTTERRGLLFLAGFILREHESFSVMRGHSLSRDTLLRAFNTVSDHDCPPSWSEFLESFAHKWTVTDLDNPSGEFSSWDHVINHEKLPSHPDRPGKLSVSTIWVTDVRTICDPWPEVLTLILEDLDRLCQGLDLPYVQSSDRLSYDFRGKSPGTILRDMIDQAIYEFLLYSPAPRSRHLPRYLLFKDEFAWTVDMFMTLDLRGLLKDVFVLILHEDDFIKEAMRHFPHKGSNAKGIKWSQYIRLYEHVMNRSTSSSFRLNFSRATQDVVSRFLWMPRFSGGTWNASKQASHQEMHWASPSVNSNNVIDHGPVNELPNKKSDLTRLTIIVKTPFRWSHLLLGDGPQPYVGTDGRVTIKALHPTVNNVTSEYTHSVMTVDTIDWLAPLDLTNEFVEVRHSQETVAQESETLRDVISDAIRATCLSITENSRFVALLRSLSPLDSYESAEDELHLRKPRRTSQRRCVSSPVSSDAALPPSLRIRRQFSHVDLTWIMQGNGETSFSLRSQAVKEVNENNNHLMEARSDSPTLLLGTDSMIEETVSMMDDSSGMYTS